MFALSPRTRTHPTAILALLIRLACHGLAEQVSLRRLILIARGPSSY